MRLASRAYHRRRGWMAWHIGVLGRAEFKGGYPSLESLSGEGGAERAPTQSDAMMAHNVRLWRAMLNP